MKNKQHSWWGFLGSLLFHFCLFALLFYSFREDDSANGHMAQVVDTNISMEMIMGMIKEEPEPEPIEPQPELKEEVPDPTVKPEPPKPKKKKEQEKPKKKKEKKQQKNDREIKSDAKINSLATGPAKVTTNNPNLIGNGANSDELSAYRSALRREIERHKRYPQRARMMRKQGIVHVSFTVNPDGSLSDVQVKKSSGFTELDNAAMTAVKSARPIGNRPVGMSPSISVPISFRLR